MRAILAERHPDARALEGTAELLPLQSASVDAVLVGSAFHWFDQVAALAEVARVLRAPGVLGLLGNAFDTSTPWVASLRAILGPPAIQRPGHWPPQELLGEYFEEISEASFPHSQRVDLATLRDLASSRSSVAILDPVERDALLARIETLWRDSEDLTGSESSTLGWVTRVRRCSALR